jgi:hypothetical protein
MSDGKRAETIGEMAIKRDPNVVSLLQRLRDAERLRYSDIENALAEVLRVPPDRAGAFRGRIRHLRNIGVPEVPHPGHGRPASYSVLDALEILIALRLHALGVAPKVIAPMAHKIMLQYWLDAADERAGKLPDDLYVILFPSDARPKDFAGIAPPPGGKFDPENNPPIWFLRGVAFMPQAEKHLPREFTRMNVSAWARDVFRVLETAASEE